jgi:hypothetical protein
MIAEIDKIFLERHSTKLSLAVSLLDDYSKGKPIGRVEVSLKGRKEKPLDLPDGSYTIRVRSDYYFDEDSDPITLSQLDPKNPIANITLKPKPSYPFPPGATLIRGKVYDSAGEAVSGAKVRVRGKDVENKTTEEGEFALYFGPLTEDEIIIDSGKRFVMGDSDKTLHLEVEYDSVIETIEFEAEEGKTTSVMCK